MADDGFPRDDYTPHGLLANPYAVARSWKEAYGGVLRTSRDGVGVVWVYPWALGAEAHAELRVEVLRGERRLPGDTGVVGDHARATHHSARLLEIVWEGLGYRWTASFVQVAPTELGVEVTADRLASESRAGPVPGAIDNQVPYAQLGIQGWRKLSDQQGVAVVAALRDGDAPGDAAAPGDVHVGTVDLGPPYGAHELLVDASAGELTRLVNDAMPTRGASNGSGVAHVGVRVAVADAHQAGLVLRAIVRRRAEHAGTAPSVNRVGERVRAAIERARADDDALWSGGARVEGDWPDEWRRGWVYDLETTRMCVFPAGGVFTDVWPSWMVQWPRAVVAEGTLDMVRLAYLSPNLAKRAVLSLFRDAPAPNVPCIFQHGEPNMVAKDGSVCGTSPAWCVPFYNLERLYLLTLDDAWLAALYPYLARYVEWWLAERTDAEGWAVYKCTWEAGEDDTPRLDPERRGDNVVSEFVRPVELQATMALSASVLARFADRLGRADEAERWRSVAATYAEKTRTLWDPAAGRFRDWDARAGGFLEPAGEANYWGMDPCRFSALAFTPVLAGLADEEQVAALSREVELYDRPPWTLWASWSYVVLESALAAGWGSFAARVAAGIVGRVYAELDRRTVEGQEPTPGVAREYWPLDLSEWRSCEGYGWGATTASFLARQIFGFLEDGYPASDVFAVGARAAEGEAGGSDGVGTSAATAPISARGAPRESSLTFRLAPGLPADLLVEGRRYVLANVPYRGTHVSAEYRVERAAPGEPGGASLTARIATRVPMGCRVLAEHGEAVYASRDAADSHEVPIQNGALYRVELLPGSRRDQPGSSGRGRSCPRSGSQSASLDPLRRSRSGGSATARRHSPDRVRC